MNRAEEAVIEAARAVVGELRIRGDGGIGRPLAENLADAVAMLDTYSSPGIELVAAERRRQVMEEGWTPEHDDAHTDNELASAGAAYALGYSLGPSIGQLFWPRDWEGYKPGDNNVRTLTKSAALIVAEIDRLIRYGRPMS